MNLTEFDKENIQTLAELIAINPTLNNRELSSRFELPIEKIHEYRSMVTDKMVAEARERLLTSNRGYGLPKMVKPFKPKAKKVIVQGKEMLDVSEWFGIVEYGGQCYGQK